ncbi:short-chain collagen C4-like [Mytilus trossulus]|uniref:short-chain collagen C4-like n=1 Tax=Mytilus trossulus TaxID=6551 RepID=UPI00300461D2
MLSVFHLLFGLLFVFGCQASDKEQYRRLLLNDPDVIGNRLAHLESSLQSVTNSLTDLQTKYGTLQKDLAAEKAQHIRDMLTLQGQSSTYIRWGRSNCSGINTELVYSGYAAGEKYTWSSSYKGGASNMLCLPNNPELSDKAGSGDSFIFGTEFEGNLFASDSDDEDVPCALCRSSNTASSVMIPGRKTCYAGWKKEYNGKLAASAYSYTPSPYICVDANPTYVNGGQQNNNDHLLYVTAMKCGSLPCPPYKDNVQVYCVVCSK